MTAPHSQALALGLDFGTESVRALLVTLDGAQAGVAVVKYPHGQITDTLPTTGEKLPPDFALQNPQDWVDASAEAVRQALNQAGPAAADHVVGVGTAFTSCTMLPAMQGGAAMCRLDEFADNKYAWPKLWKHHAAKAQTDRINDIARQRREPWLARYGGIIGLEWFFPKILETLDHAPDIYEAAEVWLEGGDWYVWQLIGGDRPVPRSTCQAGYKAMWNAHDGYPSREFFEAVHPKMADVVNDKMPGTLISPGQAAGTLCPDMAEKMGLKAGLPVSAAIIDAHAGVPGSGVAEPNTLVMVMGTSSCHMLNAEVEKLIPGVAGVVEGGILPGYFGYETGQAAVGDAFDWLVRMLGGASFDELNRKAAALGPGAGGVMCLDWVNGCRTPLMDGSLTGAFTGLTLAHQGEHLYRALLEATGFGLRWIVEVLEEGSIPVNRLMATGGLPYHNPLLVQIYADILGRPVSISPSRQGPALGAAVLGVLAAGSKASGFDSARDAIASMVKASADSEQRGKNRPPSIYTPGRRSHQTYDKLYARYRELAAQQVSRI